MEKNIFDKAVNRMVQANQENNPPDENAYMGDDGFLHCPVCREAKQQIMNICGRERVMSRQCLCDRERLEKELEEDERLEHRRKVSEIMSRAFDYPGLSEQTFENDDRANAKISDALIKYTENFREFYREGQGLLLYGTVGTGKSYLAACIANRLIENEHWVRMTSLSRIINKMWGMSSGKQDYLDEFGRYALLVLDDLGVERNTEYAREQVYNVIDGRIRSGKPMIITTNLLIC